MVVKINTDKYSELIQNVIVDDRENQRIDFAMSQYAALNPVKAHLDIGDYIFVGHNGVQVVFEYKTGLDFLNSINDEKHHLHNQVYEMTTNFDYTFVVVECVDLMQEIDSLYYSSGVSMSLPQVNGAISEFNTVSSVVFTQTQYQAFDFMMRQAGKIIMQKPLSYKYGKKSTNPALNWLMSIKGLDKQAEAIVRKLDLKTKEDIDNLTKERLMSVDGIGDKKAENILKSIWRKFH